MDMTDTAITVAVVGSVATALVYANMLVLMYKNRCLLKILDTRPYCALSATSPPPSLPLALTNERCKRRERGNGAQRTDRDGT